MANATVYTDASFCPQSRRATFAYVVRHRSGRLDRAGNCPGGVTAINQAEMYAVYAGLHNAKRLVPDLVYVDVRTDSDYVRAVLEGENKPSAVTRRIAAQIAALGLRLNVKVVRGHQAKGVSTQAYMNDFVHRLAYRQLRGKDPRPTKPT